VKNVRACVQKFSGLNRGNKSRIRGAFRVRIDGGVTFEGGKLKNGESTFLNFDPQKKLRGVKVPTCQNFHVLV